MATMVKATARLELVPEGVRYRLTALVDCGLMAGHAGRDGEVS